MKQLFTIFFAALFTFGVFAQNDTFYVLQANNIAAGINNKNNYFWDLDNARYEFPKGSGVHSIFASALWISAMDTANNLRGSFNTYYTNGDNFSAGPISTFPYPYTFGLKWNKLFHINRNEINYHLQHYNQAGYAPIAAIADWPAHGDTLYNEAYNLAPFVDVNHNGKYEPLSGDYPDVPGDDNVFFIVNDKTTTNTFLAMGTEVHFLFYQIQSNNNYVIDNTTFMRATVFNRSNFAYHDLLLSSFDDFDLGCSENDYIGCDTIRNATYVYNGTTVDSGSHCLAGIKGYSSLGQNATQSVVLLNKNLYSVVPIYRTGTSLYLDPRTLVQARQMQLATNYYHDSSQVNFLYTGNPNDTTTWSERTGRGGLPNYPGDRRTVTTIKVDVFAPGQAEVFDFAYTSIMDSVLNNFQIVNKLLQNIDSLQTYYDAGLLHSSNNVGIADPVALQWDVFPNPAKNEIQITAAIPIENFAITDLQGRVIAQKTTEKNQYATIDIANLASGVYLLQIHTAAGIFSKKIMKE